MILTSLFLLPDIKADNIMFGIKDDSVFTDIEENELQQPVPRKEVDERTIYMSRELKVPKGIGAPVLCDFGSAMVVNDEFQRVFIQPQIYRAPEVILGVPWTYSADIWNVGCMVGQTDSFSSAAPLILELIDLGFIRRRFLVHGARPCR